MDAAHDRLEVMRANSRETLAVALRSHGSTFQDAEEREVIVRTTLQRLEQLNIGDEALVFGRIDELPGDAFHIGRLAISAEDQEPLVVDWRAPIAEPFYRATGRHPMGLARRRHFSTAGRRIVGIEDEVFSFDGAAPSGDLELAGTGALLAALERSRSGQMRDIVATVQREQDEIIRADLGGVLVVQGGPGTGKTAVALHRAAYLLYTFRFPLEGQGVLMVGPNPLFLRYVSQVLPSLGENGVTLTTIEGLVSGVRVRAEDNPVAAHLKGDERMAGFIRRAVKDRQRPLRSGVEIGYGGFTLVFSAEDSAAVVATAKRRAGTHNGRRRFVELLVAQRLQAQLTAGIERRLRTGLRAGRPEVGEEDGSEDVEDLSDVRNEVITPEGLARELRLVPAIARALDRMWPLLTAEELLHDLYGAPALIALAARGKVTEGERAVLARRRSTSLDEIPWTAGDLPILDEARVLLGSRNPRADGARQYGHIVVDEAQDMTPMQLRMLARRSLTGSMTVVGDVAQATGHRAPSGWDDITAHLPHRKPTRVVELSVNYRTPSEIMDVAGRVLAAVNSGLSQPRSVRSTGTVPEMIELARDTFAEGLADAVVALCKEVRGASVAVICPPSRRNVCEEALRAAGIAFGAAERDGLEAAVTVVPVAVVKGLEFDGVLVVEPAAIVSESPQGLRALYVALTRATKCLTVVHADPLPESLRR